MPKDMFLFLKLIFVFLFLLQFSFICFVLYTFYFFPIVSQNLVFLRKSKCYNLYMYNMYSNVECDIYDKLMLNIIQQHIIFMLLIIVQDK